MLVLGARQILADLAGVRHDDAHVAHLDHGLGHELDRGEQAVDVVGAFHQHLQLPPAQASRREEFLGVLEAVVIRLGPGRVLAHRGRDDLPRRQRGAVVHGDDADVVVGALDDHGGEALALAQHLGHALEHLLLALLERQVVEALLGDDHELREVYGVRALADDLALRPALSAAPQEFGDVLEITRRGVRREHLR